MPPDKRVDTHATAKKRRMRFSRSRFGCDPCRNHKKKCDEARPVCGRCNSLRKVCSYSYPQAGRAASDLGEEEEDAAKEEEGSHMARGAASTSATVSSPPTTPLPSLPKMPTVPVEMAPAALVGSGMNAGLPDYVDDSFLRAFSFSSDVVVPPWTPPEAHGAAPPGSEFESFWNALVGGAGDHGPGSNDQTLIEYYRLVVSPTILGIEDGSSLPSQFYKGLASTATEQDQAAMMHAVLAVSAQHLSNFARAFNNLDKAVSFNEQAAHHRSEALYLLRVASQHSSPLPEGNEALLPSVTLLLTLSSVLKGDADIIPAFLDQTQAYLDKIEHPSSAAHLSTITAIYSIYRVLQAIASSQSLDLGSVFHLHEPRDMWTRVADETVERLVGIPREMLLLFSRVNNLVLEWRALEDPSSETALLRMELRSQCSMIQHDLEDDSIWSGRWSATDPRIGAGLEFFRAALRIMIMRDAMGVPASHPRVERCVDTLLAAIPRIRTGTEIGLVWPWLIVACETPTDRREGMLAFIRRCQWKGSAPPRIAEAVVHDVWEARATGRNLDWRAAMISRGSPFII